MTLPRVLGIDPPAHLLCPSFGSDFRENALETLRAGRSSACAAIIVWTLTGWLEPSVLGADPPPGITVPGANSYWNSPPQNVWFEPAWESQPGLPTYESYDSLMPLPTGQRLLDQPLYRLWNAWFKDAVHNYSWLPGSGDHLGFTDFDGHFTVPHPWPIPLTIRPIFVKHFVNGPSSTDLPPRIFEGSVDLALTGSVGNGWTMEVAVRPGLFGDFEHITWDMARIQGRMVATKDISPTTQLVLGFVYLDRKDIAALPAVGVIWKPSPDTVFELVLPKPKIAQRILQHGNLGRWIYLSGELGGNSWLIERANGKSDIATYRDYRLIAGVETTVVGGIGSWLEVGYVFGRRLEYQSNTPQLESPDAVMFRAGFKY